MKQIPNMNNRKLTEKGRSDLLLNLAMNMCY